MNRTGAKTVWLHACAISIFQLASIEAQTTVQELDSARRSIDATGFAGTVVVLDLDDVEGGSYVAGHAERVDRRLIPASTFKIFNSLVAFETGIVTDPQTVLEWDGVMRSRPEVNRDLDMHTAFQISAVPHFQELARRIGAETMQHFIDLVGYGNGDISGGIDMFWLRGGLRISPREQVEFLERLYRGTLPFSPEAMEKVKQIMESERAPEYTIRSKTGWAVLSETENVGWWVGWVERGAGVHIFAAGLEASSPDVDTFLATRQSVAREVLGQLGVLETSHSGDAHATKTPVAAESEELLGLLDEFAQAWNRHDVDALMSMMTEDGIYDASAGSSVKGKRYEGQAAVRAAFASVFESFADAHWGGARHVVSGDRGFSEWTFTGTLADGTRVEVNGCDLFTFRDGKIAVKNSFRKNRITPEP